MLKDCMISLEKSDNRSMIKNSKTQLENIVNYALLMILDV